MGNVIACLCLPRDVPGSSETETRVITLNKTIKADLKTLEEKVRLKTMSMPQEAREVEIPEKKTLGIEDFTLFTVV